MKTVKTTKIYEDVKSLEKNIWKLQQEVQNLQLHLNKVLEPIASKVYMEKQIREGHKLK